MGSLSTLLVFVVALFGLAHAQYSSTCTLYPNPGAIAVVVTPETPTVTCIDAEYFTGVVSWTVTNVTSVGELYVIWNDDLEELHFPDLVTTTYGEIGIWFNPKLVFINFPSLVNVYTTLAFQYLDSFFGDFYMPLLTSTGALHITWNGAGITDPCVQFNDCIFPALTTTDQNGYNLFGIIGNLPHNPRVISAPLLTDEQHFIELECGLGTGGFHSCDTDYIMEDLCYGGHCTCEWRPATSTWCLC